MKRIENKYYIPAAVAEEFKRRVVPFVQLDPLAHRDNPLFYTVRSIYFDTPELDAYFEKIEGTPIRKKVRIRGYNQERENCIVILEVKRKHHRYVWKDRAPVHFTDVSELLSSGSIDEYVLGEAMHEEAASHARRFLFHLHSQKMIALTNVVYDRTAFIGKFDPTFRLTFDFNLRYALRPKLEKLFSDDEMTRESKRDCIMEIKYFHDIPVWLRSLISEYELQLRAISKYGLSIEALCGNGHPSVVQRENRLKARARGIY